MLSEARLLLPLLAMASAPAAHAQWSTGSLSEGRWFSAGTAVDGYALVAGGTTCYRSPFSSCPSSTVDIYEASTGNWSATSLETPRFYLAATTVGHKALFAGGWQAPDLPNLPQDVVDIYDATVGPPTDPAAWSTSALSMARGWLSATTVGDLAIFAGGSTTTMTDRVDIYDNLNDTWTTAALSEARCCLAATTVGTKALFAGGLAALTGGSLIGSDVVDIYDASVGPPSDSNAWSVTRLSVPRALLGATTVGHRAFFAGGGDPDQESDVVDIYDSIAGTWSTATLSQARRYVSATTVGDLAIFAGGDANPPSTPYPVVLPSDVVDVYNASTDTWSVTTMAIARAGATAVTVGDIALFAGGARTFSARDEVDLFEPDFGTRICSPAVPNSTGLPASIHLTGRANVSANELTLTAKGVPPGSFGIFVLGRSTGFVPLAGGQGTLCLSGVVGRFTEPSQILQGPVATLPIDLSTLPLSPPVAAAPGDTWVFQFWYRDSNPIATSNFSDAVSISLQ